MASAREPLLAAHGVVKRFGHVQALQGADFTAYAGEVVALIGDNGAGKSTLVNVLSGVLAPDEGEVRVEGKAVRFGGPMDAQRYGLETVYQDLSLAPDLDAASNLYLGREVVRGGLLGRALASPFLTPERRSDLAVDSRGYRLALADSHPRSTLREPID